MKTQLVFATKESSQTEVSFRICICNCFAYVTFICACICIQIDICRQQTGASAGARVSFVVPRSERRGGRDTPMGFVTVAATRRMEVILLLLLLWLLLLLCNNSLVNNDKILT